MRYPQGEIATTEKDIDIFYGWVKRLENPDPTILAKGGGSGIKLYDEVDRDPHAGSVLQTRYLAVISREWEIIPSEDAPTKGRQETVSQAQRMADFVKGVLEDVNFDQSRQELMQAILYGYYGAEIIWEPRNGGIVPVRIIGKHPKRFVFDMDRIPYLLTPQNMIEGEPLPERKFIIFSYGSSDNPYGKGLGQKIWWPVWFKKNGIKFWLVFLEKFGMPTAVGKYPPGTDPSQQAALLDAIDAIQNETGIKIPDTMTLELLEATRAGNVTYESLCDYMDRQISKAVLGQTLTTEVKGEGSYAASQTHNDVRMDILKADADLLCECLNNTLIRWIVDLNFPDVTDYPKLWIRTEPEKDLKSLVDRDEKIAKMVPVPRRYIYETYNIPQPEGDEDVVAAPSTQGDLGTARRAPTGSPCNGEEKNFSSQYDEGPARTLDAIGKKALDAADLGGLINPIKKLLDEAESLEDFRDRLLDAYGDMNTSDIGDLIQQAMTLADLAGRFDAYER